MDGTAIGQGVAMTFDDKSNALKRSKILLVEDESLIALYLTDTLEDMGYTVCGVASSGTEAIEIAGRERPDLALVDIGLRGNIDGIETARILTESYATAIVFTSGAADPATRERAAAVQPLGFLQKPYDADKLKAALDGAFRD
jgi:CheY-like chemotaxis protein